MASYSFIYSLTEEPQNINENTEKICYENQWFLLLKFFEDYQFNAINQETAFTTLKNCREELQAKFDIIKDSINIKLSIIDITKKEDNPIRYSIKEIL